MSVKAKYIKDLPLKNELDGSESLLVQDSNGTKQAPLGTIVDEIKQNSQEKIREIESELDQTNAQLSEINLKKANVTEVRKISDSILLKDLHTEVKTAMTGGSVGVVGINSVNTENIVDESITLSKMAQYQNVVILGNATGNCMNFNTETKTLTIPQHSYITFAGNRICYNGDSSINLSYAHLTANDGERSIIYDVDADEYKIVGRKSTNINKVLLIATMWSNGSTLSINSLSKYTVDGKKVDNYGNVKPNDYLTLEEFENHGNVALLNNALGNVIDFNFDSKIITIPQHTFITCGGKRVIYNGDSGLTVDFSSVGTGERSFIFDLTTLEYKVIASTSGALTKNSLLIATWWGNDDYKTLSCTSKYTVNGKKVDNYNQELNNYALKSDLTNLYEKTLQDKKVLILGDSITTDSYHNYKKWVTVLIECGFLSKDNVTNSSKHATGFVAQYRGEGQSDNDFIHRIESITDKESYDLVIIFGGINDFIQSVPFGESGGDVTTEFIPAVDYFFDYVINNFTQARIVVLSPLRTYNIYPNKVGKIQQEYADYIKSKAKEYCFPILNLTEESGFCPYITSFRDRWTLIPSGYDITDGVHPNEEYEREFLAPMIKNFLSNLF